MSSFLLLIVIPACTLAWAAASLLVAFAFGRAVRRAERELAGSRGVWRPVVLRDPCPGLHRFTQSGVLREDAPPEWATLR
ncbi:hypothetical protein [Subtercola boreus]|uniref:hypothetical protein n=1 Tax=Subtercola boreus TaxID=120213 RepID=UPI001559029E|nr:hypothetical protein [Subtercola boreus]